MNLMGTPLSPTTGYSTLRTPQPQTDPAKADKSIAVGKENHTQDAAAAIAADKNQDQFVHSAQDLSMTYGKHRASGVSADRLMELQEQRTQSFQNMLQKMVVRQGTASNLTLFDLKLNVTSADSAKAALSIGDGGEYSVDQVAGRIMDMAKALANGDTSKLDTLRTAAEKGFSAAGVDFGGKLPSICDDTYTEVMKRFDDWETTMKKESAPAEEVKKDQTAAATD